MKLSTAVVALGVSAATGVVFALMLTIAPAVIYILTGVNVTLQDQ